MVTIPNQGGGAGQFSGLKSFKPMAGKYFQPPHLLPRETAATMSTTGARYYIVPFIVEHAVTYAGAWCYNGGAGDNGDKAKIAIYNEAANGGPGTLAKSFGEITFTGAAAIRNFASSWSATPGKYYLEFVTDNAVTMYVMTALHQESAAGFALPNVASLTMGQLGSITLGTPSAAMPTGDYVGGTYANFPEATSLTPATTLFGSTIPQFGLYT